jgi:hypothetical protein
MLGASCHRGASRYKVGPPPPAKDTPCPPTVVGKVAEGCSMAICAPPHSFGSASVVVHEPTGAHVLFPQSQMPEIRLSSIQVALPQCIPYALWHRKVAKPFKARPPKLTALWLGPAVPSRQQAHPTGMKPSR